MTTPTRPLLTGLHPLDILPLYKRWHSVHLRNIALTLTWSMMIGTVLMTIQAMFTGGRHWSDYVVTTLVVSNTVGLMNHGGLVGLNALLGGWPRRLTGAPRAIYYMITVSLLSITGIVTGNAIMRGSNPWRYLQQLDNMTPLVLFAFLMSGLMFVVGRMGQRRAEAQVELLQQREEMAATAHLLSEAKLRALQAQIEPHFLYNTLANVLGLIDSQPAQARHMLERFIDFLRASLDASRAESATVGAELDLAAAYLDVLAVRMGKRLQYRIEADDAARAHVIAPMLIQPLVENAIMHGLEPKIDGGTVILRVQGDAAGLVIDVVDDGVGIGNAPQRKGGGVGMANVKARIASKYGDSARLQLLDNPAGGAIVRLLLPNQIKVPSSTSPQP